MAAFPASRMASR
uniref:Uncharacterized protein n=1 Tax=Arundo donax TaxID=35708 RepID=A0A0A8YRY9_ARUDO